MSNSFGNGVWTLDTADNSDLLQGVTGDVRIARIEWQPGASGQSIVVKDGAGEIKISRTSIAAAPAGNEYWDFTPRPLTFHEGVVLHTLGGGTVYMYLA